VYCGPVCRATYRAWLNRLRRDVEWRAALVADSERQLTNPALRANATKALTFQRAKHDEAVRLLEAAKVGRAGDAGGPSGTAA
jgi:hypothetical protein